jgi:Mg-chelatase subunit ChlI
MKAAKTAAAKHGITKMPWVDLRAENRAKEKNRKRTQSEPQGETSGESSKKHIKDAKPESKKAPSRYFLATPN